MSLRRVVVTGLGLVTPLGSGVDHVWQRILSGHSGIGHITAADMDGIPCKIAGEVPFGSGENGTFDPNTALPEKERRKNEEFIILGIGAADQAIADSGLTFERDEDQIRAGVMIGSGVGGLEGISKATLTLAEKGPRRLSPFIIPSTLINLTSGQVSIKYQLRGPNHSVVTACSTGCHAIGDAARLIALDDADVMVAGGSESSVSRLGIAGFAAARALSTGYNDTPEQASRPWDKGRDGFVMGSGAGIVVLEEYERAKKRGAKIYAEVTGYGMSGDAHHITAPSPTGDGAFRAMQAALKRAQLNTDQIDYINAHGTSTPLGDLIEIAAVKRLFAGDAGSLTMSSTKSAIGHLLGAAGAVEAVFSVLSIRDNICPPTLNLDDPDEGCDLDFAPHQAKERPVSAALSNSFGFGGTNASLIFSQV